MSNLNDSDSSGLSDGWAVVNTQGDLEDSDASSSSCSIEVVQQEPDPASQCSSLESTELEQLMKKADAAAAAVPEVGEPRLSESVASGVSTTPDAAVDDDHLPHLSVPKEPSGANYLRRESTGEEEEKTRTISAQSSPEGVSDAHRTSDADRASHADGASHADRVSQMDQASQTDRASPVLSDRRLSLSSLWSFSSQSSGADVTSSEVVSTASSSTDADTEGHGSSVDTDSDTEPEFVCLETEASSSCAQSVESSMSRSGVKASAADSRSSVGSEFNFLPGSEDFIQTSVSTDLKSLPPADLQLAVQQDHHHHHLQHPQRQQQPYPQTPTSRTLPSHEEQLSPELPQEQAFAEELVETGADEFILVQSPPRAQPYEHAPLEGDDVEAHEGAAGRLSHSSLEQLQEGDVISPPVDNLRGQDLSAEDNIPATTALPKHVRRHSTSYLRHWLGGHFGLAVGALLMLFLAFGLGHWLGATWVQSKQLRKVRNEHRQCVSEYHHLQQQADATLKREKKWHQETVTGLENQQQQLSKRLKEAEQRVEQLLTASSQHPHDSAGDAFQKERQKGDSRQGRTSEDPQDQESSDIWGHLYFSMRGERDLEMNASDYLHYFTRRVNTSALLHQLAWYWNVSRNWTMDLSSSLSGLQESVVQTVPAMWRKVSSTLSQTSHAFASNTHQPAKNEHGKEKGKYGEKDRRLEDESDEEAYVEDEGEFESGSRDYDDWEVEGEEHDKDIHAANADVDAANGDWTEDEYEYVDTGAFEQMTTDYEESKAEDETYSGNKHRKRWSGIMNKFLKKTQKMLSRVGKRFQKTWHKIKDTSQQLWSDNSAFSRMAAKMRNSFNKFSSKLQKKAHRWFKTHFKEKKHPEAFRKHEKKEAHATGDKNVKKSDHQHNKTHNAASDKLHENKKNKQTLDTSSKKDKDEYKSEKHGSEKKIDGMADRFVKDGIKEGMSDKVSKDQKEDNPGKLVKDEKKERLESDHQKKKEKYREVDRNEKNEEPVMLNREEKKAYKSFKPGKEKMKGDRSNKLHETDRKRKLATMNQGDSEFGEIGSNKKERRLDTLNTIKKERRSDKSADVWKKGDFPTHHHTLSHTAVARTKFRLQSQFQELFSKISSMNKEVFKNWSSGEISKMADDMLTFAKQYNSKLHVGLPASGSQWLKCQHAFWVSASSHHEDYELLQSCFRFLAPWQTALLEEEDAENSSEKIQEDSTLKTSENDWEDWNFLPHADHMEDEDIFVDYDDYADDCDVHPDKNCDDESDDRIQENLASKGQREDDENTNTPANIAQPENSQQLPTAANQAWYMHRAEGRNILRSEDHKADWMFERAKERDEARQENHKADWVFERAAERDANRHKNEDSQGRRKPKSEKSSQSHERQHNDYGEHGFRHEERGYRQKYGRATFCLFC